MLHLKVVLDGLWIPVLCVQSLEALACHYKLVQSELQVLVMLLQTVFVEYFSLHRSSLTVKLGRPIGAVTITFIGTAFKYLGAKFNSRFYRKYRATESERD